MAKTSHTVKPAETSRRARQKAPFPDLPGSTGEGKAELGVACPFVPICLRPCTELPAPGWPPARESAMPPHVALPARSTVTLWEPEELRRTGRQDTPEREATTLNQLCYNKDTQCPEGTHTWRDTSQHIPDKKLWLTRSAAPSQGLDSCSLRELESLNLVNSSENLYVAGQSSAIWTLLASSLLSKARKLPIPRAMAAQTDQTASSQHNPTIFLYGLWDATKMRTASTQQWSWRLPCRTSTGAGITLFFS